MFFKTKWAVLIILFFAFLSCNNPQKIKYSGPLGNWESYGGTSKGQRFSALTQLTPENVNRLDIAWEYHTGDVSDGNGSIPSSTAFEATPILVENTLFIPTPFNRVIALDPESGEERWIYDPKIDLSHSYANQLICRGVSYWQDPDCINVHCPSKILMATNDARLISLDAKTGNPNKDFGEYGEVDLVSGVGEQLWKGEYQVTSPPAIAGNLVIVGSAIADNTRLDAPSGVIRAYDISSGEIAWSWDLSPPSDSVDREMISANGYLL